MAASYFATIWLLLNWAGYDHPNAWAEDTNPVLHLGYNVAEGGGVDDPVADPWAFASTLETNYQPAPGSTRWIEKHWQAWGPSISVRPLSLAIDKTDGYSGIAIVADTVFRSSGGGPQRMSLYGTPTTVGVVSLGSWNISGTPGADATYLRFGANNAPAVLQANNGSPYATYSSLVRYDNTNTIILGDSTVSHIKVESSSPPSVTSCDDLIMALDAMGLISDDR